MREQYSSAQLWIISKVRTKSTNYTSAFQRIESDEHLFDEINIAMRKAKVAKQLYKIFLE